MSRLLGPWAVRWLIVPALAGAALAVAIDPEHPPIIGPERFSEVVLLDGQVYFGHLSGLSGETITLTDVYYFQDARGAPSALTPLALVQRGSEAHGPADGLRIRRDKVLLIEEVGATSQVMRAIATQRSLERLAAR